MYTRFLKFLLPLLIGAGVGLWYGWIVDPIEYVDITPEFLRTDYQVDYVLMVAEAFQAESDPELAARRLALLGSDPPADITHTSLEYARSQSFSNQEILQLEELHASMQIYSPSREGTQP